MAYPHTLDLSVFDPLQPIADSLSRCVHGLAAESQPYASAVAVVYHGRPLLFTAYHVVDGAVGRRLEIATPAGFEPLSLTPDVVAGDPEVDAAVVLLPEAAFGWGIDFWRLQEQRAAVAPPAETFYLAMGYAARDVAVDRQAGTRHFVCRYYFCYENKEAYRLYGKSLDGFVATNFDLENSYRDEVKRWMRLPHGMSGGALWRMTEYGCELAGVLTEYQTERTKCLISAHVRRLEDLARRLI